MVSIFAVTQQASMRSNLKNINATLQAALKDYTISSQQHFSKPVSSPDCDCMSRCIASKTNTVNVLTFQQITSMVILLTVCLMVGITINIAMSV